jgi:hypothetical protein
VRFDALTKVESRARSNMCRKSRDTSISNRSAPAHGFDAAPEPFDTEPEALVP